MRLAHTAVKYLTLLENETVLQGTSAFFEGIRLLPYFLPAQVTLQAGSVLPID